MNIVPLVTYDALAEMREEASDLLHDTRYWSTRVMGCKEAMPEAYDPEYAVAAQAMLKAKVALLKQMLHALKYAVAIFNEHDEYGVELYFDRYEERFDFHTGCGVMD